jgi:WD40 repeat protein/tetratricopeptide (TPR) repeat protein
VLTAVLTVGFVAMALLWSRAEQSAVIARANELKSQILASKEAKARGEAQDLAEKEAKARGEAETQQRIALEKAELLAREDYVNRVSRAYREVQDDNVALAEDLLHGCDPGRRGWEWHFVERLCNSESKVIDLGNTSLQDLAVSPDGTWAVSGSGLAPSSAVQPDGSETPIEVWEVRSGRRRIALRGGKGRVYTVAVSPDGGAVAAGFGNGLAIAWEAATGQTIWARTEPGLHAMSVAFSPDRKSLAVGYGDYSGGQKGRVKIWDVRSGQELSALPGPTGGVNKLAYHPNGNRLAVAGAGIVEVWDLRSGCKVQDLKGHKKWVYTLAYSPDGQWLATGGWDKTVKLRNAETGIELLTIFAHEGFVLDLAFSPDSRSLVTTSEDRSVRLWEVPSGRRLATFHGHAEFVQAVAFLPDGLEVVTGGMDGSMRFWDLRTSRPIVVTEHSGWVEKIAFRKDGLRVLSEDGRFGGNDGATKAWNPFTGELDPTLSGIKFDSLPAEFVPGSPFFKLSVASPDGKLIAQCRASGGTGSQSKQYLCSSIVVIDSQTGGVLHTLTGHSIDVVCLAFSPDGRRLATGSYDRTVKLWDVQTGQEVFTLIGHTSGVVSLAFSPDGRRLVSGGIDSTARVWNATPLPADVTAEHDARYRKKVATIALLKAATDDRERGMILFASAQWDMSAEAFARAVKREPEKLDLRYQLIEALVNSGNKSQIEQACDEMVERFMAMGNPEQALNAKGFSRLARMARTDRAKQPAVHEMVTARDDNARILILAKHSQWDLISECMARSVTDQHGNVAARQWYLLSLLVSADIPGYRSAAEKLLSIYRNSSDPNALNNAAWACTYVPNAVTDLTIPAQMAETAVVGYAPNQKRFALNTLGAALYRSGRFDDAIARLDESVKASGGAGVPQDWVYLAMAHHKKRNAEEARRWLEKVGAYVKDEKITFSADLVEIRILLRQLEDLFGDNSPARR